VGSGLNRDETGDSRAVEAAAVAAAVTGVTHQSILSI